MSDEIEVKCCYRPDRSLKEETSEYGYHRGVFYNIKLSNPIYGVHKLLVRWSEIEGFIKVMSLGYTEGRREKWLGGLTITKKRINTIRRALIKFCAFYIEMNVNTERNQVWNSMCDKIPVSSLLFFKFSNTSGTSG